MPAQAQQPVIRPNGVVNAAGRILQGLPNSPLAQGSLFIVKGRGLGAPPFSIPFSFPLQTTVNGTSMQITVGGTAVDALMLYVAPGILQDALGPYDQIGGIVPSNTPVGDGTLTVTYNGNTSAPAPVTIVPVSFGMFTVGQGTGPGVFTTPDLQVNTLVDAQKLGAFVSANTSILATTLLTAAHPGDQLVLWGTGLGSVADDSIRPAMGNVGPPAELHVGNVQADVSYQGRASCCPALDQIVFTVPDGVQGCYVPVVVKIGDTVSNFATISVSPDNTVCSDPAGFSTSELQNAGSPMTVADIQMTHISGKFAIPGLGALQGNVDTAEGHFRRYNGPEGIFGSPRGAVGAIPGIPSSACSVFPYDATGLGFFNNLLPNITDPSQGPDAGSALNITGPAGVKQLPRVGDQDFNYRSPSGVIGGGLPPVLPLTPDFLMPGNFTLDNGPGGADIRAFQAALTIPDNPVAWTNQDAFNMIPRSQDLTVTWSGSGNIAIIATSANPAAGVGAALYCVPPDPASGSFTIPAWVLSSLPASGPASDVPAPVGFLALGVTLPTPGRFQAPGLDAGYFNWAWLQIENVQYQ